MLEWPRNLRFLCCWPELKLYSILCSENIGVDFFFQTFQNLTIGSVVDIHGSVTVNLLIVTGKSKGTKKKRLKDDVHKHWLQAHHHHHPCLFHSLPRPRHMPSTRSILARLGTPSWLYSTSLLSPSFSLRLLQIPSGLAFVGRVRWVA